MSYFDTLLEKRNLDICPLPLWKLKITDEEFKELRILLENRTHVINLENPFYGYKRECALFFAEYWRRLYDVGAHSLKLVYNALNSSRQSVDLSVQFYEAAQRGGELLGIEKYKGGRIDPLNDLLYQGGLPMKLVTGDNIGVWNRFARGLVNSRINYDELNLGLVATKSQSMRDFCNQIIDGVDRERPDYMPFYCENQSDSWYQSLIKLAKEERKRQRELHPFSLDWDFTIDTIERKINTKFVLKGVQKLPLSFLNANGLENSNFFTVQVRLNGKAVDTFDYNKNFCRYSVISNHSCNDGDNVSVYLHNQEEPYLSKNIDMSIPHLLYRDIRDGHYYIGNRMGETDGLLLLPEGWSTENEYATCEYSWKNQMIKCVELPADFVDKIVVNSKDGIITFGKEVPVYYTRILKHPLNLPVVESLYNLEDAAFSLCYDTTEGVTTIRNMGVEYRNMWQQEWSKEPSYGMIFVKTMDPNGNFVSPVRLINIGDGLIIETIYAINNSCKMRVSWMHGSVSTQEGVLVDNDIWLINKEDCSDSRKIRFTFSPSNGNHPFTLNIKSPFRDFSILNIDEESVGNCYIPYSDIDRYKYHLVGQNISYTYGNIAQGVQLIDGILYLKKGQNRKQIPTEGSLLTLLGSHEELRSMLDRTSENMLYAEIPVVFNSEDGNTITIKIKDAPFKPIQEDNKIVIITRDSKTIAFKNTLKLLKLDDPTHTAVEIKYNEEKGYELPEEIRDWGKTLVIGKSRGRVRPVCVEYDKINDADSRRRDRQDAIKAVNEELNNSHLGDLVWNRIIEWFDRSLKDDIPANSLLDLHCIAQKAERLLCFAFILFGHCSNDKKNILNEQLKSFSNDLGFQWYWLYPKLGEMRNIITDFICDLDSCEFKEIYLQWALQQGERMQDYLSALETDDFLFKTFDLLGDFDLWIKELCISSMYESYDNEENSEIIDIAKNIVNNQMIKVELDPNMYIDYNQNNLDEYTKKFFENFNESNLSGNEQWLTQRVNAIISHFKGSIDLFMADEDEMKSEKIRRSIVFASKSSNFQFLVRINNKLIEY